MRDMEKLSRQAPKVSVVIPTYQRGHVVQRSIDGDLAQSYQDFEVIVIDDGSTDDTRDVVGEYRERVRYILQQHRGPASARKTGNRMSEVSIT